MPIILILSDGCNVSEKMSPNSHNHHLWEVADDGMFHSIPKSMNYIVEQVVQDLKEFHYGPLYTHLSNGRRADASQHQIFKEIISDCDEIVSGG